MKRLAVFLILFAFWLLFSGHFDALHLTLGIVCCGLVAMFSSDLLFPDPLSPRMLVITGRFLVYIPWLLWQIVLANLHVLYLVVRPGEIRPQVMRFRTRLRSDLAQVTLATSGCA